MFAGAPDGGRNAGRRPWFNHLSPLARRRAARIIKGGTMPPKTSEKKKAERPIDALALALRTLALDAVQPDMGQPLHTIAMRGPGEAGPALPYATQSPCFTCRLRGGYIFGLRDRVKAAGDWCDKHEAALSKAAGAAGVEHDGVWYASACAAITEMGRAVLDELAGELRVSRGDGAGGITAPGADLDAGDYEAVLLALAARPVWGLWLGRIGPLLADLDNLAARARREQKAVGQPAKPPRRRRSNPRPLTRPEKEALDALTAHRGNKTQAAAALGISRASLDDRLRGAGKKMALFVGGGSVRARRLPTGPRGEPMIPGPPDDPADD